ncbi:M23 family metallopeptidase [Agromyces sp. MMS24-K17]|uniref:M23 family metallopeptidase n=1 Tax=Agromyces sp. MMS24-K17 TaxID=3372850 RepID=UPI0037547048
MPRARALPPAPKVRQARPAVIMIAVLLLLIGPIAAGPATAVGPAAAAGGAPIDEAGTWHWPVAAPIRVTAPFRAPETRYSAGHRGIDLAATTGDPVTAPADGVVSFAGMVAGRPVVSIDHGLGVVSSLEPVIAQVEAGTRVERGRPIGTVGAGGHCDDGCVHLGARVDGEYVSPHRFLGGLPRAVLLPWGD